MAQPVWFSVSADDSYLFKLQRGGLSASPALETALGPCLATALVDRSHIAAIFERLGIQAAVDYFAKRTPESPQTRHGDFGEVLAAELLLEIENVRPLIQKLRYRETRRWSMKLTDIFGAVSEDEEITQFVFGEAKAYTTKPPSSLATDAYTSLLQDLVEQEPEIMFFTLDRLWDRQDFEAYARLDRAMKKGQLIPRSLRVVLIADSRVWDEEVLTNLHEELDPEYGNLELADDLVIYFLERPDLRTAIDSTFTEANRVIASG